MKNDPFRLVFRRSQTQGKTPTFSLLVSAEMSSQFEDAAKTYGAWNELVYVDPKLEEARELRVLRSKQKHVRANRRANAITSSISGETAFFLLPFVIMYKLMKWTLIGPFKLAWWIFKARTSQREQIIRFHELVEGKTITTQSVREIVEAEQLIQETTEAIKAEVLAAMNYNSEAFEVTEAAA